MHAIVAHGHKSDKCSAECLYSVLLNPLFIIAFPWYLEVDENCMCVLDFHMDYLVSFNFYIRSPKLHGTVSHFWASSQAPPQKIRKKVLAGRQGLRTKVSSDCWEDWAIVDRVVIVLYPTLSMIDCIRLSNYNASVYGDRTYIARPALAEAFTRCSKLCCSIYMPL